MSDKKKFTMFNGISLEDLKNSENIVGDAVQAVANQGGAAGAILNHALGLTGSEGEAFSEAVKSYSNAYNPLFSKMIDALQDENIRKDLMERLARNHNVVKGTKKKEDK